MTGCCCEMSSKQIFSLILGHGAAIRRCGDSDGMV